MREQGASFEEINDVIKGMLKDYGINIPEKVQMHREMMRRHREKQREEIRSE